MLVSKKMFRQGDILLIKVDNNPLEKKSSSKILLAGTLTGHNHIIENGDIYFKIIDRDNVFAYIEAKEGCKIVHDEHNSIDLEQGIYEARRQREVKGYVED